VGFLLWYDSGLLNLVFPTAKWHKFNGRHGMCLSLPENCIPAARESFWEVDGVDLNSLQLKQELNPVHSPSPYKKTICSTTASFGDLLKTVDF